MDALNLIACFLVVVGVGGWINARFLHLPTATIMVLAGLFCGGALLGAAHFLPSPNLASEVIASIGGLDFPQTVLQYMLGLLLFAGAMQVDLAELRRQTLAIFSLATIGVIVSSGLVALGLWLTAKPSGFP